MEPVRENIRSTLHSLEEEQVEIVITKLTDLGVTQRLYIFNSCRLGWDFVINTVQATDQFVLLRYVIGLIRH